ncbi:MAG: glycosyltransferase family 9 protein [Parachlamydiales bacterium]|jgi:ADP-heptose:LPS heptosyltransferase
MKTKLKNFLILQLVRFFKKKNAPNRFDPASPRILVVSTTALGDTLWATALIKALKKNFPASCLAVLTSQVGREVLENNPHLDEIFSFKEPLFFHFFRLFRQLNKNKFQAVLFLHASQRLALPLVKLLQSEYLVGSKGHGKGLEKLFTHSIETGKEHELERRFNLAKIIGLKTAETSLEFHFKPPAFLLPPKPYLVFHPGSKEPFRRWPLEYYMELAEKLSGKFTIVLIGTPQEKALLETITAKIERSIAFYQKPSLSKTAHLISQAELFIGNDSGPLHLAESLKIPSLSFFAATDPDKCGPLDPTTNLVLKAPLTCRACLKKKCLKPVCLYQIKPQKAYIKSLELIKKNQRPDQKPIGQN